MNIFIMLAIILTNAIAITLVYQFVKRLPKMDKIVFIAGSVGVIYVLVSLVYWISGFGIDAKVHEAAKSFITYTFVPVDIILFIPFIATKYNKWKQNEIGKEELIKRIIKVCIFAFIILIVEFFYFKGMQNNIIETIKNRKNEDATSNIIENSDENNITNEITNNAVNEELTSNIVNEQAVDNSISNKQANVINNTVKQNVIKNELE